MSLTLTLERLGEVLDYDPETGIFTWKVAHKRIRRGKIAGTLTPDGYLRIGVDGKLHRAHRLAWLYVSGSFPNSMLDHVNGNRSDNRIANLRLCNDSLNQENLSLNGTGTTGYLGVSFRKNRQKFVAQIRSRGIKKCLGSFETALEAHRAYLKAKKTIHQFQGW